MYENEELTAEELAELSDEAWDLIKKIQQITASDSPRGRKVSPAERRELLRSVTALAAQLAIDLVD